MNILYNSPIKHYSFRYLDERRKVFIVTTSHENDKTNFYKKQVYSVPFFSETNKDNRNALLAYTNPDGCSSLLSVLNQELIIPESGLNQELIIPESGLNQELIIPEKEHTHTIENNDDYLYSNLIYSMDAIKLNEFKYLSDLFKMPLIVVLNSFCDTSDQQEHYELYYYFNQQKFKKSLFSDIKKDT
jgi:hypothetical protein